MAALSVGEIENLIKAFPSYRSKQIFSWLHAPGISTFEQMTNLPQSLRDHLSGHCHARSSSVDEWYSDPDGTQKARIRLADDQLIESVILTDEQSRGTACLSTQAGCAMGCSFCMTATMGFKRNLEAHEIVEQFLWLRDQSPEISHIVFMGMGEPMENFDNTLRSIALFHDPKGAGIGHRRMTISTCGIADGIVKLAKVGPPVGLAVSLVSAEEDVRSTVMPISRKYGLKELREALLEYIDISGRRVTLEYVLLKGVNDSQSAVNALKDFMRGLNGIVNVIPLNPGSRVSYSAPTERGVQVFLDACATAHINVTRRYRRGRGINGACGQLALQ